MNSRQKIKKLKKEVEKYKTAYRNLKMLTLGLAYSPGPVLHPNIEKLFRNQAK